MNRRTLLAHLRPDERGQDLVEYAMVAAFVALAALLGAMMLSHAMDRLYGKTAGRVNQGANFSTQGSTSTDCGHQSDSNDGSTKTSAPTQTDSADHHGCQ